MPGDLHPLSRLVHFRRSRGLPRAPTGTFFPTEGVGGEPMVGL